MLKFIRLSFYAHSGLVHVTLPSSAHAHITWKYYNHKSVNQPLRMNTPSETEPSTVESLERL